MYKSSLVWFRRDLRCYDHAALSMALQQSQQVHCCFVFDTTILEHLPENDRRVAFIHASLVELKQQLISLGGDLWVLHGNPQSLIPQLAQQLQVDAVYCNHDYELSAIERDQQVALHLQQFKIDFHHYKDQVIFEKNEILTQQASTYSVYTPYQRAWFKKLQEEGSSRHLAEFPVTAIVAAKLCGGAGPLPTLAELGFSAAMAPAIKPGSAGAFELLGNFLERIDRYQQSRDFPAVKGPSYLSVHLRFGTISIRHLARLALEAIQSRQSVGAETWLKELVWRDFYFMILYHHPRVQKQAFKAEYDKIVWASGELSESHFSAWCAGQTGYPLVDAAMRQLAQTGYMHNRLRMVTASFLVKHLGIDWRRGEAWFALHLNDFDLAANNGGWQWAASTGCDAQPYFRIFNPVTQSEKFDAEGKFIKRYVPELAKLNSKQIHAPWTIKPLERQALGLVLGRDYPDPVVDHTIAREATLARFGVVRKV